MRSSYDVCDTYFVEHDSRRHYDPRAIKRQRQEDMAAELSQLTADEYLEDVVHHMRSMEVRASALSSFRADYLQDKTLPDVSTIDIQEEIQWYMRPFLMDFLVEAHSFFHLLPETLHLAINLLDRYCSRRVVYRRHYQLVGCAALLISAKYGDKKERVPTIRDLNSMCCSLYDEDMFTQMEWHVLNTLDWTIGAPTVDAFLQIAMQENRAQDGIEVEHMSTYLAEIALYHKEFVSTKPSVLATAALALARVILRRPDPMNGVYTHEIQVVLLELWEVLARPSQSLARKYASQLMSHSSRVLAQFLREQQAMSETATSSPSSAAYTSAGTQKHDIYSTPVKGHQQPGMANGYMTPPITPDGDSFTVEPGVHGFERPTLRTPSSTSTSLYQQYFPPTNVF
jgi:hypothetical protein